MFIVVMGVSGSGKSTVGAHLAARLAVPFVDADDLHPASNTQKMAAGQPLTDQDRWPWLDRVGQRGQAHAETDGGVVIACSALKGSYRDVLRDHGATHFVHLTGSPDLLTARLRERPGHFMGAGMLNSQLVTLEPTADEPDVLELDIADPPTTLVDHAARRLRADQAAPPPQP